MEFVERFLQKLFLETLELSLYMLQNLEGFFSEHFHGFLLEFFQWFLSKFFKAFYLQKSSRNSCKFSFRDIPRNSWEDWSEKSFRNSFWILFLESFRNSSRIFFQSFQNCLVESFGILPEILICEFLPEMFLIIYF